MGRDKRSFQRGDLLNGKVKEEISSKGDEKEQQLKPVWVKSEVYCHSIHHFHIGVNHADGQ
jgi:hypothetical protein